MDRFAAAFEQSAETASTTPVQEAANASADALSDFLRSHPPSAERAEQLRAILRAQRERLKQPFYVGTENLRRRIPRAQQEFPKGSSTSAPAPRHPTE